MKLATFALCFLAACSAYATPPGDPRVRYTVGFAPGTDEAALKQVVDVYKKRMGSSEFAVDAKACTITAELQVSTAFRPVKPERTLEKSLSADARTIQLSGEGSVGLLRIGEEWLRVEGSRCERGLFGSTPAAHESGKQAQLLTDDDVRSSLGSRGEFELLEAASDEVLKAQNTTSDAERKRFDDWREQDPTRRLEAFDTVPREQGGPVPGLLWRRHRTTGTYALLLRSAEPRFRFTGRDLASTGYSQDQMGYPALSFELTKERQKDFGDWTASLIGHGLAIVLGEEILTLATVKSRLPGGGIIEGGGDGFTQDEVKSMRARLDPKGIPLLPLQPLTLKAEFLP